MPKRLITRRVRVLSFSVLLINAREAIATLCIVTWRVLMLVAVVVPTTGLVTAVLMVSRVGRLHIETQRIFAQRAVRWLCQLLVWAVGVDRTHRGTMPPAGSLLVANHLSWLDIVTVLAAYRCTFVAKHEVQSWPVVGTLGNAMGVIWIDRMRVRDVVRVMPIVEATLRAGHSVLLFAEGTTSNGSSVLPFRTGLFQSAVRVGAPVVPIAVSGSVSHGDVDALCWYGDESLVRNVPRLIALRGTTLSWHVGAGIPSTATWANRKHIAADARSQIVRRFRGVSRRQRSGKAKLLADGQLGARNLRVPLNFLGIDVNA